MKYIPSLVQIETVNRHCNARCPMCTIKFIPDTKAATGDEQSYSGKARKPEIMTLETFKVIADKCKNFVNNIKYLSLHGCGEPLMDRTLAEKVNYAHGVGFKEIGFTSNCGLLKRDTAEKLLHAGLNCIIPSIDGVTKDVHEAIRPRLDYNDIIRNVKYFIEYRDKYNFNCKVLIRMIRQQLNYKQWDEYHSFWSKLLNPKKGDNILKIDIHNTGGKVKDFDKMKVSEFDSKKSQFEKDCFEKNEGMCPDLFSRLSVFASGSVALCSADQSSYYYLGNLLNDEPLKIFNGERFNYYREKWLEKDYMNLDYCKDCTVAISRHHKCNTL